MKKNIFLILFAVAGFAFATNAQNCCSSKDEVSCTKNSVKTSEPIRSNLANKDLAPKVLNHKEKTEKFTVYGNCGMCEKTIETSLKDVDGIITADWDKETDEMTVVFNSEKISLDEIKQKIADVGYDSDSHRAKDEVYNNLPGCCQYDRPEK